MIRRALLILALLGAPALAFAEEAEATPINADAFPGWKPVVGMRAFARDIEKVYPAQARAAGVSGRVVMRCHVSKLSYLTDCAVAQEAPTAQGFGAAAFKLMDLYRVLPPSVDGRPASGGIVDVPLSFAPEASAPVQRTAAIAPAGQVGISWKHLPGQTAVVGTYPPNAYRQNIPGQVTSRCRVKPNGRLGDCQVIEENPQGYDFAKNAPRIIQSYWLQPKGADGSSVEGLFVTVTIRWSMEGIVYSAPPTAERVPG